MRPDHRDCFQPFAHPKVISRGRFDVPFADGSWIALGSLSRAGTEGFVTARNRGE